MAASLSAKTISVLKSTAPVLTVHGDKIATRFYDILFEKHPEARDSFNMSHHRQSQESGVASLQVWYSCYIKIFIVSTNKLTELQIQLPF